MLLPVIHTLSLYDIVFYKQLVDRLNKELIDKDVIIKNQQNKIVELNSIIIDMKQQLDNFIDNSSIEKIVETTIEKTEIKFNYSNKIIMCECRKINCDNNRCSCRKNNQRCSDKCYCKNCKNL
jgi:hypothetical protein